MSSRRRDEILKFPASTAEAEEAQEEWNPVLIDDRSHVKSIVFAPDEESEDDEDETENKKEEEPTKSSSSSSKQQEQQQQPQPKLLTQTNCFTSFYAGDVSVRFRSSEGATINCNVVRLHSLLRPPSSSSSSPSTLPSKLFGASHEEQVKNQDAATQHVISKLESNQTARIEFVERNIQILTHIFMPTVQASSSSTSSSSFSESCVFISTKESFAGEETEQQQTKQSSEEEKKKAHLVDFSSSSSSSSSGVVPVPRYISREDCVELFDRPELLDRLLYSYSILLGAFGWRLHSFDDGSVDRATNWKARYNQKLAFPSSSSSSPCSPLSIVTGILRCLIDLRMRRISVKFVQFLFEELSQKRIYFLRNVWEHVWMKMVLCKGLEKEEQKLWEFDEKQMESWLKVLNKTPTSSDED